MQTDFFTTIVELAHERPITAADFEPFVGRNNWLAFCNGEPLGECPADEPWLSGVVYGFTLIGVNVNANTVSIVFDPAVMAGPPMVMDADELAIRMDES